MTDAALQGTYSDLKFIKTRKVVQMVLEMPIEQGDKLVEIFGVPQPDNEVWVAVARIHSPSLREERPPTSFHELPRSQQAGILCEDTEFCRWTFNNTKMHPVVAIYKHFNIESRRELNAEEFADDWGAYVMNYRTETGQQAEER